MTSAPRLVLPENDWAERYARRQSPELFAPTVFEATRIVLSLDTRRTQGFDLRQVKDDLLSGMMVERREGNRGPYYVLHGTWHQIFADAGKGEETRTPMARVTSIKAGTGLSRLVPVCPVDLAFQPLWEETFCDLAGIAQAYTDALRVVRIRRSEIERAKRTLSIGKVETSAYGHLHRLARQRYAPLQTVLNLLERRSELSGRVETTAVVVKADSERVNLLMRGSSEFTDDRPIRLVADNRTFDLPILAVDGRDCELPQPRRPLVAGEQVSLVQQARFGMGKNSAALTSFLDANVEGCWDHLAKLLCTPADLPSAVPVEPARFLSGVELNAEQRAAVAGGLSTPHAFLIQGPPGTGKTTVITELILQLATRGERVLLLAPMHVAVDEVLRRIGDRPEVFAIRLSHDDAKVSEDLRRFLLPQISAEYLRRARSPATSKSGEWGAAADEWSTLRVARAAHAEAVRAVSTAIAAESMAAAMYQDWEQWYGRSMRASERRLRTADEALSQIAAAISAGRHRAAESQRRLAALPFGRKVMSWLSSIVGNVSEIDVLAEHARAATAEVDRLAGLHLQWTAEATAGRTGRDALLAERDDRGRRLYGAMQDARQRLAQAQSWREQTTGSAAVPAGMTAAEALAQVDKRIAVLNLRIVMERRWCELIRPEDADHLANELRHAGNVFCCTTTGVTARALVGLDFDTLIVDEASRVIDSEFLIGAVRARRWIMVGDERQLPPYVETADEYHLHAVAALHKVSLGESPDLKTAVDELAAIWKDDEELHAFRADEVLRTAEDRHSDGTWEHEYRKVIGPVAQRPAHRVMLQAMLDHLVHSLFERAVRDCAPSLKVRLVEQRRMIEPIAALVRGPVYGGDYRSPPPAELLRLGVTPLTSTALSQPVTLLDTSAYGPRARHELYRNGCFNPFEVGWIVDTCRGWERELRRTGAPQVTISVLAFYRRQATLIREALGWPGYKEFRALKFQVVDAIDKIQGQEADLVIVSFCRSYQGRSGPREGAGRWLQDIRRLNVACTRARRALILVGHGDTLRRLNGVEAAEQFYANLFEKLDGGSTGYGLVRDR